MRSMISWQRGLLAGVDCGVLLGLGVVYAAGLPTQTYRQLIQIDPKEMEAQDKAEKPRYMQRQRDLLAERYDLRARFKRWAWGGAAFGLDEPADAA